MRRLRISWRPFELVRRGIRGIDGLPQEWHPRRQLSTSMSWLLVIVSYLGAFLVGLVGVANVDFGPYRASMYSGWWQVATTGSELVGITMLIFALSCVTSSWLTEQNLLRWKGLRTETRGAAGTFLAFILAALLMAGTNGVLGYSTAYPIASHDSQHTVLDFLISSLAGFQEEALFCLLIPIVLLAAGRSLTCAVCVSAVLRMIFHMYYGPGGVWLALWAGTTVVVVWKLKAIWGVILMHSIHDVFASLATTLDPVAQSVGTLLSIVAAVLSVVVVLRWISTTLTQSRRKARLGRGAQSSP